MADIINTIFSKIDKDGDGTITQTELDAVFKVFDADSSGTVSKDEFSAAFTKEFSGSGDQANKVFSKLDKDGSGDISLTEISDLFKLMDTDGNGTVSKDEFTATWTDLLSQEHVKSVTLSKAIHQFGGCAPNGVIFVCDQPGDQAAAQ